MANRIIKETITTSENLNNLTPEEECFFLRLTVKVDDFGRYDARPTILRAACFPLKLDKVKEKDIERWLQSLVREKLISIYYDNGKPYLYITTWKQHQRIRAEKSKYPEPQQAEGCCQMTANDSECQQARANVPVNENENVNVNVKKDMGASPTFTPPTLEEVQSYCQERNNEVNPEKWYDFYSAKGWMIGKNKMKDWKAAVRTWEQKDAHKPKPAKMTDDPIIRMGLEAKRKREAQNDRASPI